MGKPAVDLSVTKQAVEAELCQRHLRDFLTYGWHVVEPTTPFVANWHIDAICDHLEAVKSGEITKLIVNVPPGTTKSLTVTVMFPAWWWTTDPSFRWLTASYNERLATRDARKTRRLIESGWYQARWGDVFSMTGDQNVKSWYENDQTGWRIAIGANTGTGLKCDAEVVDDPHDVNKVESDLIRDATIRWWNETMTTRLNDLRTGRRVIVAQRTHEEDLPGYLLDRGGWEHLMLPMEYDPKRSCVTSLGFEDPRTEPNELLDPVRFPAPVVDALKVELGPYGEAGQLQQDPKPRSGGMLERGWFTKTDEIPGDATWVAYVDKAGTAGAGSRTAMGLLCRGPTDGLTVIRDMYTGQWDYADREQRIDDTVAGWATLLKGKDRFKVWVEQEPGSGGKESAQRTVERLTRNGYNADREGAIGNKLARADHFAGAAKAGLVKLWPADWNEALIRELEAAGPGATYMDQLDVCSGAYNKLLTVKSKSEAVPAIAMTRTSPWKL